MATSTIPKTTALQAQAAANLFISEHLPDRFVADQACFAEGDGYWHVPIVLAYPGIGTLGQVGEVIVSEETAAVISHTPLAVIKETAAALYQTRRSDIETTIS